MSAVLADIDAMFSKQTRTLLLAELAMWLSLGVLIVVFRPV